MRILLKSLPTLALAVLLAPAPVQAQDMAPKDPETGSPSGTVYEIPFEAGRRDAAPRHRSSGGGTSGDGTADGDASPIRSGDNGFGSSAVVPGADADSSASSPAKGGKGGKGGSERSGRQTGGRAASVTDAANAEGLIRPASASAGSPSLTRSILLLALGVIAAVALGLGARRASRGR